jgi:hypothetical protein
MQVGGQRRDAHRTQGRMFITIQENARQDLGYAAWRDRPVCWRGAAPTVGPEHDDRLRP